MDLRSLLVSVASILGRLSSKLERDVLLIGSETSLQSYDVHENKDLFFREVPDGVNVAVIGTFGTFNEPMVIIGGNCIIQVRVMIKSSWYLPMRNFWVFATGKVRCDLCDTHSLTLQGFDSDGAELFWSVTGDIVSSLALVDVNDDGILELLVSKILKCASFCSFV